MANEITYTATVRATKDQISVPVTGITGGRIDMAGDAFSSGTQSIPTTGTGTALTVDAPVASGGASIFRNLDATNYVDIGVQVAGAFYGVIRLPAGECCFVPRLATLSLYGVSNTGACILEHLIIEQ